MIWGIYFAARSAMRPASACSAGVIGRASQRSEMRRRNAAHSARQMRHAQSALIVVHNAQAVEQGLVGARRGHPPEPGPDAAQPGHGRPEASARRIAAGSASRGAHSA